MSNIISEQYLNNIYQKTDKEIKNFLSYFHTTLLPYQYIDIKKNNKWRLGKILKISHLYLRISYDGLSQNYEENIEIENTNIIRPLRQYTRGYTGPTQQTIRIINKNEFFSILNDYVFKLKNVDLKIYQAYDFVQKFRGDFFVVFDHVFFCSSIFDNHVYESIIVF